jgi:hypothetical protein
MESLRFFRASRIASGASCTRGQDGHVPPTYITGVQLMPTNPQNNPKTNQDQNQHGRDQQLAGNNPGKQARDQKDLDKGGNTKQSPGREPGDRS